VSIVVLECLVCKFLRRPQTGFASIKGGGRSSVGRQLPMQNEIRPPYSNRVLPQIRPSIERRLIRKCAGKIIGEDSAKALLIRSDHNYDGALLPLIDPNGYLFMISVFQENVVLDPITRKPHSREEEATAQLICEYYMICRKYILRNT
jgi:hypothetical protein